MNRGCWLLLLLISSVVHPQPLSFFLFYRPLSFSPVLSPPLLLHSHRHPLSSPLNPASSARLQRSRNLILALTTSKSLSERRRTLAPHHHPQ